MTESEKIELRNDCFNKATQFTHDYSSAIAIAQNSILG